MHARTRTLTHARRTHTRTHADAHSLHKRKQLVVLCCTSVFWGVCSRFAVDGGVALTVVIVLTAPPAKGGNQPYEYREQPATCLVIYCHANGTTLLFACFPSSSQSYSAHGARLEISTFFLVSPCQVRISAY